MNKKRERDVELAITEVITETIGGSVHIALSPKELSAKQRKQLSRPLKRIKYLTRPCKVDINLKIDEYEKQKSPLRSEAWLYVNGVPPLKKVLQYTRGLQPVEVELGQPVELDCEVEAVPPLTKVAWFQNGRELKGDRYLMTEDPPRIALRIPRSVVDDVGNYTVAASNYEDEIQSTASVQLLYEKPTFTRPLNDIKVKLREMAQLTCTLRALPKATVTWLASDLKIQPSDKYHMEDKDGNLTLTISKVTIDDFKKFYTCHAINEVGEDKTSARLTSIIPLLAPEFVEIFHDKSVEEGQPLLLLGKVIGYPKPTIQWFRNEEAVKPTVHLTAAEAEDGKCTLSTQGVSKEMSGLYRCVAENEVGSAKCVARISVTDRVTPPIFIVNLTSQEAIEDDKVNFSCTAQGRPVPNVTWYVNDKEVKESKQIKMSSASHDYDVIADMTIDSVTLDDSGEVKAVAKNPAGVACTVGNLRVRMRTMSPRLMKGPEDVVINEEENGYFEAVIDGKPQPSVQWFKDGTLIKASEIMILGDKDQSHSLTIKNAKPNDKGLYTIKATNVDGQIAASARLTVNEKVWPPVFTKTMTDATITEQDEVSFQCSVTAKPLPSIEWQKDGQELKHNPRIKQDYVKRNKTEADLSLTISRCTLSDAGEFTVIAKNSSGQAFDSVQLGVKIRPVTPALLKGPEDQVVTENEDSSFSATINGIPEPKIQWLKDGNLIKPSERFIFVTKDQTHTLTIKNSKLDDKGVYTVEATNEAGGLTADAKLTVNEKPWPPVFTKMMTDAAITEQDEVSFQCTVTANPLPSIEWLKDGQELKHNPRIKQDYVKRNKTEADLSLTISRCTLSDAGEFTVIAKNSAGHASDAVQFVVRIRPVKPALLKGPEDQVVTENEDSSFSATITGIPEPKIQWLRDGNLIKPSERFIFANKDQTHTLTIKNSQLDDRGVYTVAATNEAGGLTADAKLTVNEKLWPPVFTEKMLDAITIEQDQTVFRCTVNAKPLPTITWFKNGKEMKETERATFESTKGNENEVKLLFLLKDVAMADSGEITVNAKNSQGDASNASKLIVKMRTFIPAFVKGPTDLVITEDEDACFQATVTGKPTPNIQWFKEGQLIKPSPLMVYENKENIHTLTVKAAKLTDKGVYSVKATNEAGAITADAKLTVNEKLWPPLFNEKLKDETVIEQDGILLRCTVSGKPLPKITWFNDSQQLKGLIRIKCETVTETENEVKVLLSIEDAEMTDAGEFTVTATNSEGEASTVSKLTVKMRTIKPTFLKGPADVEITENENGYFEATIDGKPEPTVQWFKGSEEIKSSERMVGASKDRMHSLMIRNAQLADMGPYSVTAVNVAGELTRTAKLIVHEKLWPPVFTEMMADEIITELDETSLRCTVYAKPLPSVVWLKDGQELKHSPRIRQDYVRGNKDEAKLSLTISKCAMTDAGEFKVTATNPVGEASDVASLTVEKRKVKPTLLKGPVDQVITEDEDGSFSATVDGLPEPKIQWLKDGKLIKPSDRFIFGNKDQTHTLTIKKSQLADNAVYTVKATNDAGESSADATLTVNENLWPPEFTETVKDATIIEQDDVILRCTVNAKPLPSITWLKDGEEMTEDARVTFETMEENENEVKLSFSLKDAEMTDSGKITVIAKNSEGTASTISKLTVNMRTLKPMIVKGPVDLVITEHDDGSFQAVVDGKPQPTVQWFKGTKLIKPSDRMVYATNGNLHSLTIKTAQLDDRGSYNIKAVNVAGDITATAGLSVNEKLWAPVFTEKMLDKTFIEEEEVSFQSIVNAKPLPTFTWFKDGVEIKDIQRMKFASKKGKENEMKLSVTISKVQMEDSGELTVTAKNSEGEATISARLTIKMKTSKPNFLTKPKDLTITENDDAMFVVSVFGKPEPNVEWFKGNNLIRPSDTALYSSNDQTHSLTIKNAQLGDGGQYTVKAKNEAGEQSANAKLTVNEKVSAPVFKEMMTDETVVEEDDVDFHCVVYAKPLPAITLLKDGKELKDGPRIKQELIKGKEEVRISLLLKDSEMTDSGEFTVIAKNSLGEAIDSAKVNVKMRTIQPSLLKGPTDLEITEHEDGSFAAAFDGRPSPTIQWFKDGQLIKSSSFMVYSCQDKTHTLTIKDSKLSDKGVYTVKAVSVAGELGASASLAVKEKLWAPVFIETISDRTLIEQDDILLRCIVSGKPLPTITWLKDGKDVKVNPRIKCDQVKGKENELNLSMTLSAAEISDSGEIKITAVNSEGEDFNAARLRVNIRLLKPTLIRGPTDLVVTENEDASFSAIISGKPTPSAEWFKDDKLLKPSDAMMISNVDEIYSIKIKNAQKIDKGMYTVKAKNEAGQLDASARLTVKEVVWAPVFTEKMGDKTFIERDEVIVCCTVHAKPLPSVVWYKDNKELAFIPRIKHDYVREKDNKAKLSLHFVSSTVEDSGEYKVVATNSEGEAADVARFTINTRAVPPTVVKGPTDLTITEDETGQFFATVHGKPEPTIEWFRDSRLLQASDSVIFTGKDQTYSLTMKNAKLTDKGLYTVKASNEAGQTEASAKLTVNEKLWAPVFVEKTTDKTTIELEDISLTYTVNAKPLPVITWFKDGKELSDGPRVKRNEVKVNDNEVKLSLTLSDAAMADSGKFKIVAKNSLGEISNTTNLTVKMRTLRPVLVKGPSDMVITENDDGYFTAAIEGKPEPSIQWLKDGSLIKPSGHMSCESKNQMHILTIKNAKLTDKGVYSVKAKNEAGELDASATLTVNEKLWAPVFTEKLTDRTYVENEDVSLRCTVNANPLPTISWLKGDKDLQDSPRIKLGSVKGKEHETIVSLTLKKAELSDSGEFKVVARNSEGVATNSTTLNVKMKMLKPTLLKGPSPLVITENDDGYFMATIDGKPEPTIQWLKDNQVIRPSEGAIYSTQGIVHSLTIKNAQLNDKGLYTVKATNEAGEQIASARLTVNEKLWAPVFLDKLSDKTVVEEEEIVFQCTVNAKPLPKITWSQNSREIRERPRFKQECTKITDDEVKISLRINKCELTDSGEYRVVAKNSEGQASNSARISITSKTVKPLFVKGPSNLKIEEEKDATFVAFINGKPIPKVQWLKDNLLLSPTRRYIITTSGNEYSVVIKKVARNDAGIYTVRASNEAGETRASALLEVTEITPYFVDMLNDVSVNEGMPAHFVCKVYPDSAPVQWYTDDGIIPPRNPRYRITSKGNERRLEIIKANRFDNGNISVRLNEDLQSKATLTVEASETEIVEHRLLWEIETDGLMQAAAEFQCTRGRKATMQVQSLTDPVPNAAQRLWIVEKAFISRDGAYRVDKWSVRSYVDYTCSEEALQEISLGKMDGVKFSVQTVEFIVLLMTPTSESRWLKDGRRIQPGSKYAMGIEDDGLLHTLVINDVRLEDEGIYTIMVLKEPVKTRIRFEGADGVTREVEHDTVARFASTRSRHDYDAEALMAQLPSPIRKAKSNSQLVMEYDNRRLERTPSREFIQDQLNDFDAKVDAEFDESDDAIGFHEEDVFSDSMEAARGDDADRRSSVLSTTEIPFQSSLSRSRSLPSLTSSRGGRRKSEILYFSYVQSGKDEPEEF